MQKNVFIGKFIDQTFHVAVRVRAPALWKFIHAPWGGAPPRLRTIGIYCIAAVVKPALCMRRIS